MLSAIVPFFRLQTTIYCCLRRRIGRNKHVRSGQCGTVAITLIFPVKKNDVSCPFPLGSVHTMKKTEAKRKLRALLEEMGVNSDSHLERIETGARTFSSEAAWKENRLPLFKSSCQETMGSPLDKYLFRQFGSLPVAAIDERRGAGIHYCADANGAQVAQWRQKEAQPQDYSQHCRSSQADSWRKSMA